MLNCYPLFCSRSCVFAYISFALFSFLRVCLHFLFFVLVLVRLVTFPLLCSRSCVFAYISLLCFRSCVFAYISQLMLERGEEKSGLRLNSEVGWFRNTRVSGLYKKNTPIELIGVFDYLLN